MITGIDETGDFDPRSKLFNYFISVHIDQNSNRFNVKNSQFRLWEDSISSRYRIKGEVKGSNLPDECLVSFYHEIIEIEPKPQFSVVRIIPFENSVELLNIHKEREIYQLEIIIKKATDANKIHILKGYQNLLAWYKNRNYQTVLKMKCLDYLLGISLNRVLGWSQITYILDNQEITNMKHIGFKIDKDFVKAENIKILWNEMFRQFWQNFSRQDPMPLMRVNHDNVHPFYSLYDRIDGKADMRKVFRQNTHFLDSKASWEIRMADLIGTILHRYQNRDKCIGIGEKLMSHLGGTRQNFLHLYLNDQII